MGVCKCFAFCLVWSCPRCTCGPAGPAMLSESALLAQRPSAFAAFAAPARARAPGALLQLQHGLEAWRRLEAAARTATQGSRACSAPRRRVARGAQPAQPWRSTAARRHQ